jgi:hypothetical protein
VLVSRGNHLRMSCGFWDWINGVVILRVRGSGRGLIDKWLLIRLRLMRLVLGIDRHRLVNPWIIGGRPVHGLQINENNIENHMRGLLRQKTDRLIEEMVRDVNLCRGILDYIGNSRVSFEVLISSIRKYRILYQSFTTTDSKE